MSAETDVLRECTAPLRAAAALLSRQNVVMSRDVMEAIKADAELFSKILAADDAGTCGLVAVSGELPAETVHIMPGPRYTRFAWATKP